MKLYLAFLSMNAFVLVHITGEIISTGCLADTLPASSNDTIYLVGYSLQLSLSNVMCVSSKFKERTDSGVKRFLTLAYIDTQTKKWVSEGRLFTVQFAEKDPLILKLNITGMPEQWKSLTGANSSYIVMYYNNDVMILSDRKRGYADEDRPVCSLWAKEKYKYHPEKITGLANISFHDNCAQPTFVPFDGTCWW
uniref:Lipocalin n=1 Tax=Rhipicephalus zambeziensis TaxID=60191 RepID=A0A224YCF1_9ACAR